MSTKAFVNTSLFYKSSMKINNIQYAKKCIKKNKLFFIFFSSMGGHSFPGWTRSEIIDKLNFKKKWNKKNIKQ